MRRIIITCILLILASAWIFIPYNGYVSVYSAWHYENIQLPKECKMWAKHYKKLEDQTNSEIELFKRITAMHMANACQ